MPVLPSHEDLQKACGAPAVARGEAYCRAGHVHRIDVVAEFPGSVELRAQTQGSGMLLYDQEIALHERLHDVVVHGSCNCAEGGNCKHVAAVCLQWLRNCEAAAAGDRTPARRRVPLQAWLEEIHPDATVSEATEAEESLVFLLHHPETHGTEAGSAASTLRRDVVAREPWVEVRVVSPRSQGGWSRGRSLRMEQPALVAADLETGAVRLSEEDQRVLGLLFAMGQRPGAIAGRSTLVGILGYEALVALVATGRGFLGNTDGPSLAWASARKLDWHWFERRHGFLALAPKIDPEGLFLPTEPPCYLESKSGVVGILDDQCAPDAGIRRWFLRAPELPLGRAEEFARALLSRFPGLPVPLPVAVPYRSISPGPPKPCLHLNRAGSGDTPNSGPHSVQVVFDYDGLEIPAFPARATFIVEQGQELIEVLRDVQAEALRLDQLAKFGFSALRSTSAGSQLFLQSQSYLQELALWDEFLSNGIPALKGEGWKIQVAPAFGLHFERGDWELSTRASGDWFELGFDVEIDGERLPLAPILVPVLEELLAIPDADWPEKLPIRLADQRYVTLELAALRPVIEVLRALWAKGEQPARRWKLPRFDAALLTALPAERMPEHEAALVQLVAQLRDVHELEKVSPPKGLRAELRRYQRVGLDWLQFLRRYRFNGLLADDMGLGKTLQVLAHLLLEKESGRLEQAALVVVPTSLLGTWAREAERFAPDLRVLVLHGSQRGEHFARIGECDLILTTYPLLLRDAALFAAERFSFLILDEAQNVKNPDTQAARLLRQIECQHRICLTGTPLENHLGELWAQFDFLMPGYLGDLTRFNQNYRVPIEKHADHRRLEELTRRVRPFLLRRGKSQVMEELPPKTEILKMVRFAPEQAQLYEAVRVAVDQRVREAISERGLARSRITILDALLKLRQICCDPRLLKIADEHRRAHSAKLELLMDLLPGLVAEGRRILLFSQFTEMLGLIERRVRASGIPYVKLTGETRDRETVINQFRTGEMPLFMISLKAGGVGLSLVEADTVILYDPWWNPAIETQAADRAHRIGQERPVFVYKLVVENSVESRILDLQERKRQLAADVLEDSQGEPAWTLDPQTLQALFAPSAA